MAAKDQGNLKKVARLQQEIYNPVKPLTILESRRRNGNA
jgi:hypothetical protein